MSAVATVHSSTTLGPVTEAPEELSLPSTGHGSVVGSATSLSRSHVSGLRNPFRQSIDGVVVVEAESS